MIRYEIRERAKVLGGEWSIVAWFDTLEKAREYWSSTPFNSIESALVKVESKETFEHYHSADGKTVY